MTNEAQRLEVRTSWKARTLGTLIGWVVRLYSRIIRIKLEDRAGRFEDSESKQAVIWCVWHNRVFGMALGRRKYKDRSVTVMTSASHDGAVLEAAAKVLRVDSARGSSSRRGSAALRELIKTLKSGRGVVLTPDGPRGPRYKLGLGIIKAAQVSGSPVAGFHVHYSRAIRLKTWDRFVIPLPFSKITLIIDGLLEVPRDLDNDALEAKRHELEELMRNGVDDLHLKPYDHHRRKKSGR